MLKPRTTTRNLLGSIVLWTLFVGAQRPPSVAVAAAHADIRTIEFDTREVTQADVAVSPNDQWLVFTMLGHLFRLPVAGGTAECPGSAGM